MIDCTKTTPDEREQLFGREFLELHVLSVDFTGSTPIMEVIVDGAKVTLVGDFQKALAVHLGGRGGAPEPTQ